MRKVVAFKNYYIKFLELLNEEERHKIRRSLLLFHSEDMMPWHYIKYIEDGIYEFRVTLPRREARIFFLYDEDKLVVLFNAFLKKTQKTPRAEIEKAKRLKKEYYESK